MKALQKWLVLIAATMLLAGCLGGTGKIPVGGVEDESITVEPSGTPIAPPDDITVPGGPPGELPPLDITIPPEETEIPATYTLTVIVLGGGGKVILSPSLTECLPLLPCSETFNEGDYIYLEAEDVGGFHFSWWWDSMPPCPDNLDPVCEFEITEDTTITAVFEEIILTPIPELERPPALPEELRHRPLEMEMPRPPALDIPAVPEDIRHEGLSP